MMLLFSFIGGFMSIIKINKISKKFIKDKEEIVVLNELSTSFEKGKFYAIVGESGAGKSTLLKTISLLCEVDEGIITINNKNILDLTDDEISEIRLNDIGIVFQNYNLFSFFNSIENIMFPLLLKSEKNDKLNLNRAKEMLKYVGMEKRINHYPNELSGGEQQRIAIARALVNNPSIILADEPTGNLDKKNKEIILSLLKQISKEDKCVIVVTHDKETLKYADVILELKDGKLKNEGV